MRSTADESEDNLLSGFVYCADCGQTMIRKTVPSKTKKYFYYVCAGSKKGGNCSTHSISTKEAENAVLHAIHDQVELVVKLDAVLGRTDLQPSADRKTFNYESQVMKLDEEIDKYQGLKLRLYEDLSDGIITKDEYMEFRNRYTEIIDQKKAALERVKREWKESSITGITERNWVTVFKEYENIEALNRRVLLALVDKVLIHEDHAVTVVFKYKDEFAQAVEYMHSVAKELGIASEIPAELKLAG